MHKRVFSATFALLLSTGTMLVLSSCASNRQPDELARAVAVGERPVAMMGTTTFFAGKIGVTVTISQGIGHGTGAKGGAKAETMDTFGMGKDEASAYVTAKNDTGSPLPPVTLRLKLESLDKTSAVVEIEDFDSYLGNFAVYPAILALAPDQTAEPDPMISQLGVTSDDIPVKVSLRLGGRLETRTVEVKTLAKGASAAEDN